MCQKHQRHQTEKAGLFQWDGLGWKGAGEESGMCCSEILDIFDLIRAIGGRNVLARFDI
jgi:hypothetical protein